MSEQKRVPRYLDSGGPGTIPSARGQAARWWVPFQYTSVSRLMMATRLAMGPATFDEISRLTGMFPEDAYKIMRNWVERRLAEWPKVYRMAGNRMKPCRELTLTEDGKRDLWRYAIVTRRMRIGDGSEPPLRSDMPEDPLEALRLYARKEFLRPTAMSLVEELIGWPRQSCSDMGRHIGSLNGAATHLRNFRRADLVTDVGSLVFKGSCYRRQLWVLNDYGLECLDRHIDALRRAALATGSLPTRECEYQYPYQEHSWCALALAEYNPPKCPDCIYWGLRG